MQRTLPEKVPVNLWRGKDVWFWLREESESGVKMGKMVGGCSALVVTGLDLCYIDLY